MTTEQKRNAFDMAARELEQSHPLLTDRVDGERDTLMPASNYLMTRGQLASILTILFRGVGARNRGQGYDSDRTTRIIVERGQAFFDDLVDASPVLADVASGKLEPLTARQRGALMADTTILKVYAGIWHDLIVIQDQPRDKVVAYFRRLPDFVRDLAGDSALVKSGVAEPKTPFSFVSRAQALGSAVKLAEEEYVKTPAKAA